VKNKRTKSIRHLNNNNNKRMLTTEDFIEKAKKVYGDEYTYKNTIFKGHRTSVTVTCSVHGDFTTTPSYFLQGRGCSKCLKENKRKKLENKFIKRAKEINDDKNDYSEVHYVDDKTKVKITCNISGHGSFFQSPRKHIYGKHDCPKCGVIKAHILHRRTTKQFIEESKAMYKDENGNDLYGYDRCIYTSYKDKVELYCFKHKEYFKVTAGLHVSKHRVACKKCSLEKQGRIEVYNTETFIKRAQELHKDPCGNPLYIYDESVYKNVREKIKIKCPKHGPFFQKADQHLNSGCGCRYCAAERCSLRLTHTKEEFVKDSMRIHKNKDGTPKYGYENVIYKGNDIPVDITCYTHGVFKQTPSSHKSGNNCPVCMSSAPERRIYMYLKKLNIDFIKEYKIPGYNYRYDFYLKDLNLLIEYDGAQHFKKTHYTFGGVKNKDPEKALKERQDRDRLKDKIAEENNYLLSRIPYTLENKLEQSVLFVISKHYPYKHNNIYYPSLKDFLISQNLPPNTNIKQYLTYNHFDYNNEQV